MLSAFVAPVVAQTPPPQVTEGGPSAADKETARHLFLAGNDKFDAADYVGALDAYRAAHAIMGVPTTGYKLGKTLATLGRLNEAREVLLDVTRIREAPDETAVFTQARVSAAELAEDVRLRIPSIRVEVSGPRRGAPIEVLIDDKLLDPQVALLAYRVDPGQHEVRARAPAFAARQVVVNVVERQALVVQLALSPTGAPDDEVAPVTPVATEISPLVWIGFGTALVGAVVGTVTGVVSLDAASTLQSGCDPQGRCSAAFADQLSRAETSATVSTTAFVFAGAGVALGVIGLLISGEQADGASAARGSLGQGWAPAIDDGGLGWRF
jgi:hypothetical protein